MSTGIADALFTTIQQRILALLYGQPSRSFFASELIALTGSGSGTVQRELDQAHRKRDLAEYEGEMDVNEQLVAALLRVAREVARRVSDLAVA